MGAFLLRPSFVIWVTPANLGGGRGARSHKKAAAITTAKTAAPTAQRQRGFVLDSAGRDGPAALTLPEVVSRFSRVRSARRSAALW